LVDETPFYVALWKTVRSCKFVEASKEKVGGLTWAKPVVKVE